MNILVASINFAPDHAGIALYATDFPVFLAEQGDDVSVVSGFPYYPHWRKRGQDKGRLFSKETYQGINLFRGYLYVPKKVRVLTRLIHEATFCFFAALNFLRVPRPGIIVIFTPPFFLGFIGIFFAWLWRCPLVINVQDLPINAAMALGMVKQGFLGRILLGVEAWIYSKATRVVTISPAMVESIVFKGVPRSRISLVPNWIDVEATAVPVVSGNFRSRQKIPDSVRVVAYAGNLGVKQGVDLLVLLAADFVQRRDVVFFVIGEGADRERLELMAIERGLSNIKFLPFMEPSEYSQLLTDADIMFVGQRSGAGDNFFPSKLLGLLAKRKALLVAADNDSELSKVLSHAGCGEVCPYGDVGALCRALEKMLTAEDLKIYGEAGFAAVQKFDRKTVLHAWRKELLKLSSTQIAGC